MTVTGYSVFNEDSRLWEIENMFSVVGEKKTFLTEKHVVRRWSATIEAGSLLTRLCDFFSVLVLFFNWNLYTRRKRTCSRDIHSPSQTQPPMWIVNIKRRWIELKRKIEIFLPSEDFYSRRNVAVVWNSIIILVVPIHAYSQYEENLNPKK